LHPDTRRYWLGLYIPARDPNLWPKFMWLDGQPMPSNAEEPNGNYQHWGALTSWAGWMAGMGVAETFATPLGFWAR
jgi:hypothetical protein